jgi:transposase
MRHFGLDVHQARTTVVWIDDDTGETGRSRSWPNAELAGYVQSFGGPCRVVMEGGSTSAFLARQFDSLGIEAVVVDAYKAHRVLEALHRGRKTDRVDAAGLARLSATDWLDKLAVWVPDQRTHQLRIVTRTRAHLVKHSNMLRNAIRSLLRGEGLLCKATDLTGDAAQAWLDQIEPNLPPVIRQCLQVQRQALTDVMRQIAALDAELEQLVAQDERCQQLDTIAGCGPVTAATIAAEIGDIARFRHARALRKYAGLTPSISQSGDRSTTGKLVVACNKHLKHAMILIAQHFATTHRVDGTRIKNSYYRCLFRHGPNPAKVSLARRLCDVVFAMLRDQTDFNPELLAAA